MFTNNGLANWKISSGGGVIVQMNPDFPQRWNHFGTNARPKYFSSPHIGSIDCIVGVHTIDSYPLYFGRSGVYRVMMGGC